MPTVGGTLQSQPSLRPSDKRTQTHGRQHHAVRKPHVYTDLKKQYDAWVQAAATGKDSSGAAVDKAALQAQGKQLQDQLDKFEGAGSNATLATTLDQIKGSLTNMLAVAGEDGQAATWNESSAQASTSMGTLGDEVALMALDNALSQQTTTPLKMTTQQVLADAQQNVKVANEDLLGGTRTGTIPPDSTLARVACATPTPTINYDASQNLFSVSKPDGNFDIYDATGKNIYNNFTAGSYALAVANPDASKKQADKISLNADGTFKKAADATHVVATLTGDGTGYAATYDRLTLAQVNALAGSSTADATSADNITITRSAPLDGTVRTGQIPEGSALAKAVLVDTDRPGTNYSAVDNLWTVHNNATNSFDVYGPDGKLLKADLAQGSVINVTDPNSSIGQTAYVQIQADGSLTAPAADQTWAASLTLTGSGNGYKVEPDSEQRAAQAWNNELNNG